MFRNVRILCVTMICANSWSVGAVPLVVSLHVDEHTVLPCEPVSIGVIARNNSAQPIQIAPLTIIGDNPNLVLYVIVDGKTNRIQKSILVLEQVENHKPAKPISIQPGESVSNSYLVGVDWVSGKPIFDIGTNWLFCSLLDATNGCVESNKHLVIAKVAQSLAEMEVSGILSDQDVLRSLYIPDYLLLVKGPMKTVSGMRRMAALNLRMSVWARRALGLWKVHERDALAGRAPGLKSKGFDRLGLQDFRE